MLLQFLQIEHHPRVRIGLARHRHFQHVVVPVSMRIAALAKDPPVLFGRKIRIVIKMRRRKFRLASHSNHRCPQKLALYAAAYSLPFHATAPWVFFHQDAASAAAYNPAPAK